MKLLAQRITDKRFLNLVERFLKAGIMEGRLFKRTDTGTPQGAICSPILANITNVKKVASYLDFWVNERLFLWLKKRHKVTVRKVLDMFKHRENGKRWNFGVVNGDNYFFLYRMSDLPLTKYCSRSPENPYLEGDGTTTVSQPEKPISGWEMLKMLLGEN
jgi:hypothetical protein